MKPWTAAAYRFVKRQSQENPNVWVMLGAPVDAPLTTAR
jgi:predicted transglutaminase-like cysteine proteinase